ncbi:Protein DNA-DAMAGE INDUCIBLE 1 [Linum perenne]
MRITIMTSDEQISSLDVDPNETVENIKALLEVETQVPLQQQQLLYNGKEIRNAEKLSALGVKDDDLIMMVSRGPGSQSNNMNSRLGDPSENAAAFQEQVRRDPNLMSQLFQADPELAQLVLGNDLNRLQELLKLRQRQRSELRRQQEAELVSHAL